MFIKKPCKSKTDRFVCFLGLYLCEDALFVLLVTKQVYFRALYPLIFLSIVYIISDYIYSVRGRNEIFNHFKIIIQLIVIVCGLHSFWHVIEAKGREEENLHEMEALLKENLTDNIVYARKHGSNYDFVPVLQNYDNSLVITRPQGSYRGINIQDILLNQRN